MILELDCQELSVLTMGNGLLHGPSCKPDEYMIWCFVATCLRSKLWGIRYYQSICTVLQVLHKKMGRTPVEP
jgi:hypothetical protein